MKFLRVFLNLIVTFGVLNVQQTESRPIRIWSNDGSIWGNLPGISRFGNWIDQTVPMRQPGCAWLGCIRTFSISSNEASITNKNNLVLAKPNQLKRISVDKIGNFNFKKRSTESISLIFLEQY